MAHRIESASRWWIALGPLWVQRGSDGYRVFCGKFRAYWG